MEGTLDSGTEGASDGESEGKVDDCLEETLELDGGLARASDGSTEGAADGLDIGKLDGFMKGSQEGALRPLVTIKDNTVAFVVSGEEILLRFVLVN